MELWLTIASASRQARAVALLGPRRAAERAEQASGLSVCVQRAARIAEHSVCSSRAAHLRSGLNAF
eukprot:11715960-Alexandrium_andersonii.AAC.1